jgi:hypothetical protein
MHIVTDTTTRTATVQVVHSISAAERDGLSAFRRAKLTLSYLRADGTEGLTTRTVAGYPEALDGITEGSPVLAVIATAEDIERPAGRFECWHIVAAGVDALDPVIVSLYA